MPAGEEDGEVLEVALRTVESDLVGEVAVPVPSQIEPVSAGVRDTAGLTTIRDLLTAGGQFFILAQISQLKTWLGLLVR